MNESKLIFSNVLQESRIDEKNEILKRTISKYEIKLRKLKKE